LLVFLVIDVLLWMRPESAPQENFMPSYGAAGSAGASDRAHPALGRQLGQRALHGALAGVQGQRQGRGRPGGAVGQQRHQRGLLAVDGRRQQRHLAPVQRTQRETACRRLDSRQRRDQCAQAADLDPQPGAVGLVRLARVEGAVDQRLAVDVAGPGLGQRACQRE
jgi:hypothetical protein